MRPASGYYGQFARLGLPIVLRSLLSNSLFILDNIMIGSLGDSQLAAIAQANQLSSLCNTFLYGIVATSCMFLTQFWGKKDLAGFRSALSLNLLLSLFFGSLAALVGGVFSRPFLRLYLQEPEALEYGVEYLHYVWPVYILMGVSYTFSSGSDSAERVKLPMAAGMVSMLTNTVLNYCLIFGKFGFPPLGVRGGAIATLCASAAECLILVSVTYLRKTPGAFTVADFRFSRDFLRLYLKTGTPVLVNEGGYGIIQTLVAMVFGMMGTVAVAAISIASTLERFMQVIVQGIVHASGILVGKLIGENKDGEAYRCGKQAMLATLGASAVCVCLVLAVKAPVLSLYNVSGDVLSTASSLVYMLALITPVRMLLWTSTIGVVRAGGDSAFVMWLDMLGGWLFRLPLVALTALVLHWPIWSVYWVLLAEEAGKTAAALLRFRTRRWIRHLA